MSACYMTVTIVVTYDKVAYRDERLNFLRYALLAMGLSCGSFCWKSDTAQLSNGRNARFGPELRRKTA